MSVIKEDNELRTPFFELRTSVKSAEIPILGKRDLNPDPGNIGLVGSPTKVVALNVPIFGNKRELLEGSVPEKVSALIDRLERRGALK